MIASGMVMGISIGRNAAYFYEYLHADTESLSEIAKVRYK